MLNNISNFATSYLTQRFSYILASVRLLPIIQWMVAFHPVLNYLSKSSMFNKSVISMSSATSTFQPLCVFVYGTLLKGYSNHHRLVDNKVGVCDYIGKAITCNKYSMGVSTYPYVDPAIPRSIIHGEVYRVNTNAALDSLDELEEHPDWYIRTTIDVTLVEVAPEFDKAHKTGSIVSADIYFNPFMGKDGDGILVESGNYHDVAK